MAQSQKILAAKAITKHLPQDVLPVLLSQVDKPKRTAYLVAVSPCYSNEPLRIKGRYENVTEEELPLEIMKDASLGNSDCDVFQSLLDFRRSLLKGHQIFEEFLSWDLDPEEEPYHDDIKPNLIEYLYTKILTPEVFMEDLRVATKSPDVPCDENFYICFEDEASWECLKDFANVYM